MRAIDKFTRNILDFPQELTGKRVFGLLCLTGVVFIVWRLAQMFLEHQRIERGIDDNPNLRVPHPRGAIIVSSLRTNRRRSERKTAAG